jgi:hypothetical protein
VNATVEVVGLFVAPFSVTDHDVPDGRPVSEKVTEKVAAFVNATALRTFAPATVIVPDAGEAE